MPFFKHIANVFPSIMLGLLVLLLSAIAVRQDAAAVPVVKKHVSVAKYHGPTFHKVVAHKDGRHVPPGSSKHRKSRVHRPLVVKLVAPEMNELQSVAVPYVENAPLPLVSVYRYVFFREIAPPPPKGW